MRPWTKLFLLTGCSLVVALEAPATLAALAAGWQGPYAVGPCPRTSPSVVARPLPPAVVFEIPEPRPAGRLELARR